MKNGKNGNEVYFLEPISEIVETAFYTASIEGECPISLLLVGPSGSAKSKMLKRYGSDHIHVTDSITSQGLWDIAQRDGKCEKRFILMPDINPTLSRKTSTTHATIGNLLSITADGTVRVDDGRGEKIVKHNPMGLISACTPEIYHLHSKKWYALGLTRRIIPLFFTYSVKTQDALMKLVREDKIHGAFSEPRPIELPPVASPAINDEIAGTQFEIYATQLATNLGKTRFIEKGIRKWSTKEILPISPHVVLRTMARAHALRRRSGKVDHHEAEFILSFVSFTNPELPVQL